MNTEDQPIEQRHQSRRSEDRLHARVDTLEADVKEIKTLQKQDSAQLDRIEGQAKVNGEATKDLLEAFDALKGAWKVLNFIGRLGKPIGGVVALVAAYHAAKAFLKGL